MVQTSEFLQTMRAKLAEHLSLVQRSQPYLDFVSDNASVGFVRDLLKEVMVEVFWYAPRITEAAFLAIGRMPKERPDLMKEVAQIAFVEANHFEMAYRDYVKLGGDGDWATTSRISPASFVLGSLCNRLAEHEDPYSILGVMYLIEGIAPELNTKAQEVISRKLPAAEPAQSWSEFVAAHAEEDVAHTRYMEKVISDVVSAFPLAARGIAYGLDCFALAYPIPIWQGAWERVRCAGS